ncbi:plasma membrane snare protein [Tirmania nivea]|nr:plasma membrane snare protein [Tirmania nivea]
MKRFGFGKKEKDTPPPQQSQAPPPPQQKSANPYAQTPHSSGGYNGGYGGGYGDDKKQQQDDDVARGALFGNRGKSPAPSYTSAAPTYSSGGYGGGNQASGGYEGYRGQQPPPLNRNDSDPNRAALFGDRARNPPPTGGYGGASTGGYGAPTSGYGAPPPTEHREGLSPEEEEEEDVDAVKQQIRFTKQESVSSTRRALAAAAAAEETGRNTLSRLGAQGERLTNTKKNLDLANNQNKKAAETTRELQTLNRSMFAVHVSNPFTSAKKAQAKEDQIIEAHKLEMEEREKVRQAGYEGRKNVNDGLSGGRGGYGGGARGGYGNSAMSNAERAKYQFEADESDDEKEKEIEHNLDQIGNVVGRLKNLGIAMNKEVDRQIGQIDELDKKAGTVELGIARNTHKLKGIR